MTSTPTVAVVGLGAVGSMALMALAKRGIAAVGFEQFGIGNDRGASGGETRMFRTSYVEGPEYVPLIMRARELWLELEEQSGMRLFHQSGHLTIGDPDSDLVKKVLHAAEVNGLTYDVWDAATAAEKYPQVRVRPGEVVIFDRWGGLLRTHHSIVAATRIAESLDAEIHPWTEVTEIRPGDDGVTLVAGGVSRRFDHVLVATGPWITKLKPEWPVKVGRTEQHWFAVTGEFDYSPDVLPPILRGREPGYVGEQKAYDSSVGSMPGPDGNSVKFGLVRDHSAAGDASIDDFERHVSGQNIRKVEAKILDNLNGVYPSAIRADAFFEGFVVDNQPLIGPIDDMPGVSVLAGFSGHGFKLAPYFGELGADLATGVELSEIAVRIFSPRRFDRAGVDA